MQAIQVHEFGGPEVLQLEEVPEPHVRPGMLLVRVRAIGVNPADASFRAGTSPMARGLTFPWRPGIEAAGDILAVGPDVEGFHIGDRVFGSATGGSYAQQTLLNAARSGRLPDAFSFETGATLPVVAGTAYQAVAIKLAPRPGDTILVQGGAGGVGHMAIQIARACGARVITTVSSDEKAAFARDAGAHITINYRQEDFVARCLEETDGRGVDGIVESIASENFNQDCQAVRPGGRIAICGSGTGKDPVAAVTFPPFYLRSIDVRGVGALVGDPTLPQEITRALTWLLQESQIKPAISHTLPLAEAPAAHELLASGSVLGKIVLTVP